MPDTKDGREQQARQAERRRVRREIEEERQRLNESEPPAEGAAELLGEEGDADGATDADAHAVTEPDTGEVPGTDVTEDASTENR